MQAVLTHARTPEHSQTPDKGPHHLAQTVLRALSVSALEPPEEWRLAFFLDALYQASFRTESGRPLTGRVVWLGTEPVAAAIPGSLRLALPVPLNASTLAALLAGTEPPAALLVSSGGTQPLLIHGILAQDTKSGPALLRAEILAPAHLKVDVGLDSPLELRRNRLHLSAQKVFECGPVRERLTALLKNVFPAVQSRLPVEVAASPLLSAGSFPLPGGKVLLNEQDWPETLAQFWTQALLCLLREVAATRRSGGIVLTARRGQDAGINLLRDGWLPPPHEAAFTELCRLLEDRAAAAMTTQVQAVQSLSARAALGDIPLDDLMLREPAQALDSPGDDPEIARATRFLAGLSRVDGLLRLDPALNLLSFGGEPAAGHLPERVYLAGDEMAADAALTAISSRSFGPRNQALLRLCHRDPQTVCFAFTQDGDLRAMLWHEEKLIVWNSVHLPRH